MANLNPIPHVNGKLDLRKIDDVPEPYRSIFALYPHFNVIQSAVYNDIFYSDESMVVSAPTGSGKTTIFELAVIKLLLDYEASNKKDYKIIYISPTKALCEERLVDWHKKFSEFSVSCACVTGDNPDTDISNLINTNIIITTPEKWDSLTRRWRENERIVRDIKLFMIDEIHLLNDETRGPTLEAIVTRMKTVHLIVNRMNLDNRIRFVGVSATISNPDDIAEWFGINGKCAKFFKFGDNMRPVKLQKIVQGYPYNPSMSSPFKFDIMLSYKLHSVLLQHSAGKPSLIFCSTRKSVEMTCKQLVQTLTINLTAEGKDLLAKTANSLDDVKIKEVLIHGVACHHAGMLPGDRRIIENIFREGNLPVLVTTSTLAMGVNLPAHLVVIKSTKYYANGEYKDYNESMLFQMIGRAGRPQFDSSATAVIMTTAADKHKYENMISGEQPVESSLHKSLAEHLNAEAVLRTITDLGIAMQWLSSTFLYIRARKNPKHYGLPLGLPNAQLDKKLLEMCQIEINKLTKAGMLTIDQNVTIFPTPTGYLMARYCVALETMKLFTQVSGSEVLQQILGLISKCREFSDIRLRTNDKRPLNILNQNRNKKTIRFPLSGKIKTLDMKINCIIQAVLGCLEISETSLMVEAQRIMRIGERLLNCLSDYLEGKEKCYKALLSSITLAKCFHARIWENSEYVSRQLEGIGLTLSNLLATAGKTTFAAILDSNPRDLERIISKKPPIGNRMQDQVKTLPQYVLTAKEVILDDGRVTVEVTIVLGNRAVLDKDITVNPDSIMSLVVGDSENNLLSHEKYTHLYMIENSEIVRSIDVKTTFEHDVFINFISEDWVGIDVHISLKLFKADEDNVAEPPEGTTALPRQLPDSTNGNIRPSPSVYAKKKDKLKKSQMLQQLMDQYFKKVKVVKDTKAITRRKSSAQIKRKPSTTITSECKSVNGNIQRSTKSDSLDNSSKSSRSTNSYQNQAMPMNDKESEPNGINEEPDENNSLSSLLDNNDVCRETKVKISMPVSDEKKGCIREEVKTIKGVGESASASNLDQNNSLMADVINKSIKYYNNDTTDIDPKDENKILDANTDIIPSTPSSGGLKYQSGRTPKWQVRDKIRRRKLERSFMKAEEVDQNPNDTVIKFDEFVMQPKKKLVHPEALEPDSKKMRFEHSRQESNQFDSKTLTWRSPLVVSPKSKFSPQILKTPGKPADINETNKESGDAKKKLPSLLDKVKVFGITDKDCNMSSSHLQLTDIVSESLWETLGIKIKSQRPSGNDPLIISIGNQLGEEEIKTKKCDLNQTISSTSSGSTSAAAMPKIKTIDYFTYYSRSLRENESKQQPQLKCVASQTDDEVTFLEIDERADSEHNMKIGQNKHRSEREEENFQIMPAELEQNAIREGIDENIGNINSLRVLENKSFESRQNLPTEPKEVQKFNSSVNMDKSWVDTLDGKNAENISSINMKQCFPQKSTEMQNLDSSILRNDSWEEAFLASEPIFEDTIVSNPINPDVQDANKCDTQSSFFQRDVRNFDEINSRHWSEPAQNKRASSNQNGLYNQEGMFENPLNTTMVRRMSKNDCCTRQIPRNRANFEKDYYPERDNISRDKRSSHREFHDYCSANVEELPDNFHHASFTNGSNWQSLRQSKPNHDMYNKNLAPNTLGYAHPQELHQNASNHRMYSANYTSEYEQYNHYPATFNNFEGYPPSRTAVGKRKSNDFSRVFEVNNHKNVDTNFQQEMLSQTSFQNKHLAPRNRPFALDDTANPSMFNGCHHMNPNCNFSRINSNFSPRRSTPVSFENVGNSSYINPADKIGRFTDITDAVNKGECFDIDRNVTYHQSYFDSVDKRGRCNVFDKVEGPNDRRYYPVREPVLQSTSKIRSCHDVRSMACPQVSNVKMYGQQQAYHKNLIFLANKENFQNVRYKNTQPVSNYSLSNNTNGSSSYKNQYLLSRYFDHFPKQQTLDINRQMLNLNHTVTSENQLDFLNDH